VSGWPWWGQLILIAVVIIVAGWVVVTIITTVAMRGMTRDFHNPPAPKGRRW
jgi:cell division protein FtsX